MYNIKCEICDSYFDSKYKGREKQKLVKHLKSKHKNISIEDYYVKYYLNGIKPKCACGCGNYLEFHKFKYLKYISDHKNYVPVSKETKEKIKIGTEKYRIIDYKLKKSGLTKKILIQYFNKFKNLEITLNDIQSKLNTDKRTITSYWKELNISNRKEILSISEKTKYIKFINSVEKRKINDDELEDIVVFLEDYPHRISISEIKTRLGLSYSVKQIMNKLKEKYGNDFIKKYLKIGATSNIELDFYFILKWYFGDKVIHQFQLEGKYYDYLIEDLLIELDGFYWHKEKKVKENDKFKDNLALKYNYKILRINENDVKNIDTILKIKKILKYEI